jgi:signal peptidase I
MRRRALRATLVLAVAAASAGCGWGRLIYRRATAHRIIRVPSAGMTPTIKPGDMAAVEEGYYRDQPVRRFDIVTFKLSPEHFSEIMAGMEENAEYVQRVVGLGGETLEIKGGRVYVDGSALEETFAAVPFAEDEPFGPVKIPPDEVFLLGDNRPNSLDGRYWARPTLKRREITGKVVEIFPQ